ncbi:uncharacterized protein KY384_008148 [Bacidia gigantensis]|uniref:uncharacterized protein n=1 Tax=Bacidia gigantensis TaxID=2732470 RepID=UPI001D03F0B8|nr:uncharacterized protein KY384_008148 [Bacidia gigantensis]KAG8526719.1 hypothetical protein KY384_008148 [Bacidia gigantensis]
MESLLSLSFDYLSSHDGIKVRKGLRQLEGLLAQICLSRSSSGPDRRHSIAVTSDATQQERKELGQLKDDPAFREFFKLQEGFQWNVAMRLTMTLEGLLSRSSTGANDLLLVSTLDLLQGILLMHPPSRALFAREIYMNLLLDLLDPSSCPAIQSSTVLVLVTALLEVPKNVRCFERVDGLLAITSLFKNGSTGREVKMRIVEFFYFYLMPETPVGNAGAGNGLQRTPSKRLGSSVGVREGDTKTMEEKQAFLGKYLNNVEDLVEDLRESAWGTVLN